MLNYLLDNVIFLINPEKKYHVLGLMSGTSLDGLDLLEAIFWQDNHSKRWHYKIQSSATYAYQNKIVDRLAEAHLYDDSKIKKLNADYTQVLADMINRFLLENQVEKLDFVASHGHTIFHQPQKKYTLQIGNTPKLSQLIKQNLICNFRVQDVQLGGQGAPLVPIGDQMLFPEYDACLNIGGFANISYQKENRRVAYDICPANKVLNFYAHKLGYSFDEGGKLAESGEINQDLLSKLDSLAYYKKEAPKSLGIEWLEKEIYPLIDRSHINEINKIATFTQHLINQLSFSLKGFKNVLLTGGGAHNNFLINKLNMKLDSKIVLPSRELIDYKEALIFAFLGVLRSRNENNILAEVTGASKDHSSGKIYQYN